MARQIADNLQYRGKQFLDARGQVDKIADYLTLVEHYYPNGFITYCKEDNGYYQYNELNTASEKTGKWRKIGGIVVSDEKLDEFGKVPIFKKKRGEINQDSTSFVPGMAFVGDYVTVAKDAVVPFTIQDIEFTQRCQAAIYTENGWILGNAPNSEDIYIFKQDIFKYTDRYNNMYEAQLAGKYKIADKATAVGWALEGNTLKYTTVKSYQRGGVDVPLKSKAWVSAQPSVVISAEGVKIGDDPIVPYTSIDVDVIKQWADSFYIYSVSLNSTQFDTEPSKYIVHIEADKSFDNLANFTQINYPLQNIYIGDADRKTFELGLEMECFIGDDNGPINELYIYDGYKYAIDSEIVATTIETGWSCDDDGFWNKLFPADLVMDERSHNAVANGTITRAVNATGHNVEMIYEQDDKILTLKLLDKQNNEISRVAVSLGKGVSSSPEVKVSADVNVFEMGTTADFEFAIDVIKKENKLDKVELINNTTSEVLVTFDSTSGLNPDAPTQQIPYTMNDQNNSLHVYAKVYDEKGLTGRSEVFDMWFVDPCTYNKNGTADFEKVLSLKGNDALFCFNFIDPVAEGVDPVMSAVPTIRIPKTIIAKYGELPIIMGGKTKTHLFTDYSESFDVTSMDTSESYIEYTLKEACGLQNYWFKLDREVTE